MKVIVGLGNPGREYARTRHNVGWWVVDQLADEWRFEGWRKDGSSIVASGRFDAIPVRLVKPQTYMNLSGAALIPYLRRPTFSAATDLLVIVDDVALPVGRYRLRARGSHGGHNGLRSIDATIGADYWRVRIGIGHPGVRELVHPYVLQNFSPDEMRWAEKLVDAVSETIPLLLGGAPDAFMSEVARLCPAPEPGSVEGA